jgi:glycosyltransferase involved in cell wall biosynthesis
MRLPIALDYRSALLSRAGIARAARELARALAARDDVELHLYAHGPFRARVAAELPARATLHRAPVPARALPLLARCGVTADRLVGSPRVFHWIDYVHAPLARAAAVVTVHDLAFVRDPAWHGDDAAVLRERTLAAVANARAVVVPSHATASDLRALVPAAPVHVVPFGGDHVPLPRANTNATANVRAPYVLCVGTLEPRKNHLALLAAWRRLGARSPRLLVVGAPGWQCAPIVAALEAAVADGIATWQRGADDATLWSLLHGAEALVYPSLWEGFGFPPLEAMAAGVPVVAHDNAPMRELGDGCFQFADATSPDALAAAIERLLGDASLRTRASAAGRVRARDFRWQQCAERHAAIYREVAC